MDKIIKISQDEMAQFLEKIYNSVVVRQQIANCPSLAKADDLSDYIGEFLVHYAVSTGDLSQGAIDRLAQSIAKTYNGAKNISKDELFFSTAGAAIVDKVAQGLGMKSPFSLDDYSLILMNIEMQNKSNRFSTHSFNGALLEEVDKNGLDISKELFKDEFAQLQKIGAKTTFKTGKLNVCELSYASFGYLHRNPERVFMAFSGEERQKDDQTQREFYTQGLKNLAEKSALGQQEKQQVVQAGERVIDFYTSSDKSCMAIIREKEISPSSSTAQNLLMNGLGGVAYKIPIKVRQQLDTDEYRQAYQAKDVGKIGEILQQWANEHPEIEPTLQQQMEKSFYDALKFGALNNFSNSYADGYDIADGKLERDKFAIASFVDPVKVYPKQHQQNLQTQFS